ncbi:MAG: diguanylate cyclase [Myxococcota bacterium]|jgi:diguanylate cyclase (GGDEF)-like protein|nr:diguanylate cyclase [Myxococcota bacterium]
MTTLEHTVHAVRRSLNLARTYLLAGGLAAVTVSGLMARLARDEGPARFVPWALLGVLALSFGRKAYVRLFGLKSARRSALRRTELELGLLLVVATFAVLEIAGGLASALYPMVFLVIAFIVVYAEAWMSAALVTLAVGMELGIAGFSASPLPRDVRMRDAAVHAAFIAVFATINYIFTRSEIVRTRKAADARLKLAQEAAESQARDLRLTSPALGQRGPVDRRAEDARISLSAVSEVHNSMYNHIELLWRAMGLHSCLLLWLDTRGEELRVLECVSEGDGVTTRRIGKGEGAVGGVVQGGKALRLHGLRVGYPGLPYYDAPVSVTDFLGVPVLENEEVRGVLCADRTDGRAFEERDVSTLQTAATSLLSIIANERVFTQLRKAKSEQGRLLCASERLAQVLSEKDAARAAIEAAEHIAKFDLAVVTLVDDEGRQQVRAASGDGHELLEGASFKSGGSLAVAALKTRHYLPHRGELDPKQQTVLSKETQKAFARMRSAMVMPILHGDTPLGVLVLASLAKNTYGDEVRTTLQVMVNQLGTTMQNAKMVQRLEQLATIDGLTGLANRRVFGEEIEKQLASASRFGREMSLVVCDIDKFKAVNDTHGHAAGDIVLRGFGEVLRRNVVRDTDLAARFGGEEFVIVCEGTGTAGAMRLAERIRMDLESQVFQLPAGELKVTVSMGVATFPVHGRTREELFERADAALYSAKHGGRNQVRAFVAGASSDADAGPQRKEIRA